jgi:hypothetical protein
MTKRNSTPKTKKLRLEKWYTDPKYIKKRRNYSWTTKQKEKIYSLRLSGMSIPNIIKRLNINVKPTQVYNILRIMKKWKLKVCWQCGSKLSYKEKKNRHSALCFNCQKKNTLLNKKLRDIRKRKGLCIYCTDPKAVSVKGKMSCKSCLSITARRRNLLGLCARCNRPISKKSLTLCYTHLKKNRLKIKPQNR